MKLKQIIMLVALTMATAASAQSLHSENPSKLSDGLLNLKLGNKENAVRIGGFIRMITMKMVLTWSMPSSI